MYYVGMLDADTIIRYMEKMSPITNGVERRIRFMNETYRSPCSKMLGDDDHLENHGTGTSTSGATTTMSIVSTFTLMAAVVALLAWRTE